MRKVILLAVTTVSIFRLCAASDHFAKKHNDAIFNRMVDGITQRYAKVEPSGCSTTLKSRADSFVIDLTYDGACEGIDDKRESVAEVARSFAQIVSVNGLGDAIRSKKMLSINYVWRVSHWPLIDFVNRDRGWPTNIFKSLRAEYPDREIRYSKYKNILRSRILQQEVYYPITTSLRGIGCRVELSQDYADPIFLDKKNITGGKLVEWGLYTSEQVNKDVYPLIKGPIFFTIDCD
jgi:hypothetical protein